MQLNTLLRKISLRSVLAAGMLFLLQPGANAALSLDVTSMANQNSTNSLTFGHTLGIGSNGLLVVTVVVSSGTVSSVQYNGSNLTLFASQTQNGMTGAMFYMTAPPSGLHNINISTSAVTSIRAGAVSYFGVNPGAPIGDLMQTSGGTSNPNVTYYSDPGLALVLLGSTSNPTPISTVQLLERGSSIFNNIATTTTLGTTSLIYSMGSSDWLMIAGIINPVATLPVTFGEVKATKVEQEVSLTWNMYDLKDVQNILVERSTDGNNFAPVGSIPLPGSTSTNTEFSYTDNHSPEGTLFYRIRLVDIYGKSTYSPVTSVKYTNPPASVSVYPVPAESKLNFNSSSPISTVFVMNSTGQVLLQQENAGGITSIDISALPNGMYYVRTIDAEGTRANHKIQKI